MNADSLLRLVRSQSFDEGKIEILQEVARLARLGIDGLHGIVQTFSFDEGRVGAVQLLGDRLEGKIPFSSLLRIMEMCSHDEGRSSIFGILFPKWSGDGLPHDEALGALRIFSFDDDRLVCLAKLATKIGDITTAETLNLYVKTFCHDTEDIRTALKERIKVPITVPEREVVPQTESGSLTMTVRMKAGDQAKIDLRGAGLRIVNRGGCVISFGTTP